MRPHEDRFIRYEMRLVGRGWQEGHKGDGFTQKSVIPAFDGILLTLHCISPLF